MCSGCDGSMEKIKFMSDDMQETEFFVLEQTTVNAVPDTERDIKGWRGRERL